MAARKGDTDGTQKPTRKQNTLGGLDNAEFRGYLNPELSAGEKEQYPSWAESEAYWEALAGFTEVGVNLSLKRERKSGGFIASGTQRDPDSPNAGLCVTARAKDPATALGRLLYILTLLSHSPRWEDVVPLSDLDRW